MVRIAGAGEAPLTTAIYQTGDGFERIRDTTPPQDTTLTYRVVASGATATCEGYFARPDGGGVEAVGEHFTLHHPCDGPVGGPAPSIMPHPTELRVVDGAGLGVPGAEFVCGGVSPVILEALVSRAVRVVQRTDDFVVVILPGDTVVDGAILDPGLNEIAGIVRVVDEIPVLDLGDAVVDLITHAPEAAVETLEGASLDGLIRLDPEIADALAQIPPELRSGHELPVDSVGPPRP